MGFLFAANSQGSPFEKMAIAAFRGAPGAAASPSPIERHYTIQQIAEMWSVDSHTVRRVFQDREGVLKLEGMNRSAATDKGKRRRTYVTLRVPESVLSRVYFERTR